jgi:hypothetical protein
MNPVPELPKATIVYESIFGSTRQVAHAIAEGIGDNAATRVMSVADAPSSLLEIDMLIAGAPTHAHGLSRPSTRAEAARWGADIHRHLHLEPDATQTGMREWLTGCSHVPLRFAAFDTRADMPELFTGSAAGRIDKALKRLGSQRALPKMSFLVDGESTLQPGQLHEARDWGRSIGEMLRNSARR